jgi:SAM-dependent methyltransferase
MSYGQFATIYDYLMQDVPYDGWVDFLQNQSRRNSIIGKKVLDIACGTGEISLRLIDKGYDVTGVDLSEEMLFMAQDKAENQEKKLPLFHQNMAELSSLGLYDVVTIFCDSLNYLETDEEIISTFKGVKEHLKQDGLFLFDVHSIYKVSQIFMDETFTFNDEQVSYIWDCFPGEYPNSVEHELTFFVHDRESGLYERVEETHKQRTYPILQLRQWLEDTGFEIISISADFTSEYPTDMSERIFFTCKKS